MIEHSRTVPGPVTPGAEIRSGLCSVQRAAAALGVGRHTVRRLIESGDLATLVPPGRRRPLIVTSSIARWLGEKGNPEAQQQGRATAYLSPREEFEAEQD